jgi:hypothetical protein
VNDNEDHLSSIQELHFEFKAMQDEIFFLWVKQNITIPPLKEYIEEWLKSSLKQIIDPRSS